ncbi:hypothetical protein ACGFNX_04305 [Streptomyces sp. NPDC048723]|uniref:hypothetical protein n=1 Tax=Streptomyces sp. NPDC048723 TaxID=3365589 RepID=UPI003721A9BA
MSRLPGPSGTRLSGYAAAGRQASPRRAEGEEVPWDGMVLLKEDHKPVEKLFKRFEP